MAKSELKNVCLSVSEMRGVFVNILAADVTCSLCNRKILPHSIELQISRKQKKLLTFSVHFSNLNQMLNIFKEKMTLIGYAFTKLETAKDVIS